MTFTHAIIYVGAPYGDNESGHIVSRHKSEHAACLRFKREYSGTTGVNDHMIVPLHDNGSWRRSDGYGLEGANIVIQSYA